MVITKRRSNAKEDCLSAIPDPNPWSVIFLIMARNAVFVNDSTTNEIKLKDKINLCCQVYLNSLLKRYLKFIGCDAVMFLIFFAIRPRKAKPFLKSS